jgi:cell division protein FtsN
MPPRDYKSNTYRTTKPHKKLGLDSWDRLLIVAFITVLALVIKHFIVAEQAKPKQPVSEQIAAVVDSKHDEKVAAANSAVATVVKEVAAAGGLSEDELKVEPNTINNNVVAPTVSPTIEPKTKPVPSAIIPPRQDTIPVEPHFDFYTILPSVEVVIPDHEIKTRIREEKIGAGDQTAKYIMQAGSFRDTPEAEELKAKLTTMGIESRIEKAQVGEVMWYRVKVGPYAGMSSVMAIKSQLRSQGIDAIVLEFK